MAKRKCRLLRLLSAVFCLMLLLSLLPAPALAADPSGNAPDHPGDLTVRFRHKYQDGQERDVPQVEARMYHVATMDQDGVFTALDAFRDYPVDLATAAPPKNWMSLAGGMENFVNAQGIQPSLVKTADNTGYVLFDGLEPGLYLFLFGEGIHPDYPHIRVGFMPTLMSMPYRGLINWNEDQLSTTHVQNQEDPSVWDFAFTIVPKPQESQAICRLQKVWDDSDNRDQTRPQSLSIEVEYEDGVKQTVELTAEDGWLLEFQANSEQKVKNLRELNLPADYVMKGWEAVGATIQITNVYVPPTPTPPPTAEVTPTPPSPTPTPPVSPDNETPDPTPTPPPSPSPTPKAPPQKLPQTGVLWWPVPILLGSGTALILFGWIRRRFGKPQ